MGICSMCWSGCSKNRPKRRIVLILIGLDNAGKTQTVNSLTGVEESVMPTVGFKAVNLVHRDTPVTIYDLGGGAQFRSIWPQYYSEVHGVVFVIDSSDGERMDECRSVLAEVISHEKIAGKPILILANKQDKRGALDDIDIVEKLGIERLVNRYRCPTLVESYTAAAPEQTARKKRKLDPGLKKGYAWLLNYIVHRYGDINLRVQTDIHAELERRKRQSANGVSADCTDESLETGFENPHYVTLSRDTTLESQEERIKALEDGVIIVRPIVYQYVDKGGNDTNTDPDNKTVKNRSDEFDSSKSIKNFNNDFNSSKAVSNEFDSSKAVSNEFDSSKAVINEFDSSKTVSNEFDCYKSVKTGNDTSKSVKTDLDEITVVKDDLDLTKTLYGDVELDNLDNTIVIRDRVDDRMESSVPNSPVYKPSPKPRTKIPSAVTRKLAKIDIRWRPQTSPVTQTARIETEIEINRADDSDTPDDRIESMRTDKMTPPAKLVTSDGVLNVCLPKMEDGSVRPASASQLVRRQLEVASSVTHRRRFSLRYPLRNKTSPLPMALFHYEPGKEGEGDFALRRRAPSGDVTL